jgi:hypothetical protein
VVDHRHPLGETVGLVEVLGREQHGRAFPRDPAHQLPHLVPAPRIEPGGGLVEEQDLRNRHQAGGDVDPPPHPARIGPHLPRGRIPEAERLQQLPGARPGVAPGKPEQASHQHQVLVAGEVLVHRGVLPRETHLFPYPPGVAHDVVTQDGRRPRVGGQQGGEDPDGRGLARAVRAEQPIDRALADAEVHAVEGAGVAEAFGETAGLDRVGHGSPPKFAVTDSLASRG